MDGDRLAVGAIWADSPTAAYGGAVYLFERMGDAWTETAKLTANEGYPGEEFGASLSLKGSQLLIGAPRAPCESGPACGGAYLFQRINGVWMQTSRIVPDGLETSDQFGKAVAIADELLLVTSLNMDCPGEDVDCGALHTYGLGSDCNCNGVGDACDLYLGGLSDCNGNHVLSRNAE